LIEQSKRQKPCPERFAHTAFAPTIVGHGIPVPQLAVQRPLGTFAAHLPPAYGHVASPQHGSPIHGIAVEPG
jgi:hypothetical protein